VIGLPLVPFPWNVNSVEPPTPVNVPQIVTVVPGPIWLAPLPQLEALLNQAGFCGLLVQAPWLLPSGVTYTLVAEEKPRAENASTKMIARNGFGGLFTLPPSNRDTGLAKLTDLAGQATVTSRGVAHDLLDLSLMLIPSPGPVE
jgi:hypothetical protein